MSDRKDEASKEESRKHEDTWRDADRPRPLGTPPPSTEVDSRHGEPEAVLRRAIVEGSSALSSDRPRHVEADTLDPSEIEALIGRLCAVRARVPAEAERLAMLLRQAIAASPSAQRLVRSPVLLMLMTLTFRAEEPLPATWAELYDRCVAALLEARRENADGRGPRGADVARTMSPLSPIPETWPDATMSEMELFARHDTERIALDPTPPTLGAAARTLAATDAPAPEPARPEPGPAKTAVIAAPTWRSVQPPALRPSAGPRPEPRPAFSWLHIADVQLGRPAGPHGWNQELLLDALARDASRLYEERRVPAPQAIFVTGNIAYRGQASEYEQSAAWLERVASSVGLRRDRVYVVPGYHDVDRNADGERATRRLVRALRERRDDGEDGEDLDEALAHPADRALLRERVAAYLEFAEAFGSPADLCWTLASEGEGLKIKVVGLSTVLLATGSGDRGRLRLGNEQLSLLRHTAEDQLTLVLTHHPFAEGWLRDEREARAWVEQRADIHLCGHPNDADALARRTAGGTGVVTVAAGALHGDGQAASPLETHGYNWASVLRDADDRAVVRVWPRVWCSRKDFRIDVGRVPDGALFAEHPLPRIRAGARRV